MCYLNIKKTLLYNVFISITHIKERFDTFTDKYKTKNQLLIVLIVNKVVFVKHYSLSLLAKETSLFEYFVVLLIIVVVFLLHRLA